MEAELEAGFRGLEILEGDVRQVFESLRWELVSKSGYISRGEQDVPLRRAR